MIRNAIALGVILLAGIGCTVQQPGARPSANERPEREPSGGTSDEGPSEDASEEEPSEPPETVETPDGAPSPAADACVIEAGAVQKDLDPEDTPEKPWKRTPGQKVVIQFENAGASARYWSMLVEGTKTWSKSPCIQAEAVAKCAEGANCVRMKQARESPDDDETDGEFEGNDRGPFRTGGTITVFTKLMDETSDNGALATIVHEMGHALGLVHRLDEDDLMNAETDDDTNPVPDDVDFHNLLVIYGTKK